MRVVCLFLALSVATGFAQSDRGTITGAVSDPTGAVVANAAVEARNLENGASYQAASSGTGNYTLAQVPSGTYEITSTVAGFKKYVRQGVTVSVAQTLRIDIVLEVGQSTESVTIQADAPLLKTESGELSHTVDTGRLNSLPVLGTGAASASTWGVRNVLAVTTLIPGTTFNSNTNIRVNGAMSNTQTIAIEGQDATDRFLPFSTVMTQPSADAVQEVAIQTSNFAAEYGQVGGGYFNFTMKSGTNNFHGTAYNYWANEALNASQPYTNLKEVTRRNDFGFSFGGPLLIPKVYDGRNRTFFFLNMEFFRQNQTFNTSSQTVPTLQFRQGDFSQALTTRAPLGVDPLGRNILENTVYDPLTERVVSGSTVRDPFTGNIIPQNRIDPVTAKIQALIPNPTNSGLVNNIVPVFRGPTTTNFPAMKVDHQMGAKGKFSFYWSESVNRRPQSPGTGNADGLPSPITAARGNDISSVTSRVNYDHTLTPTTLLHFGFGYQQLDFRDSSPTPLTYDSFKELGLRGQTLVRNFPRINGLCTLSGTICVGQGGLVPLGPNGQVRNLMIKPTANVSASMVKGNHTYKVGAEMRIEGYPSESFTSAKGNYTFANAQTSLPSTLGQNLGGGAVGFPYASFYLGLVNNGDIGVVTNTRGGKSQWGFYAQDTWKVTRKLTFDYGLRYDYSTYAQEQHGRAPSFGTNTPNPTAGGRLGAAIYEATCNCNFAKNYPFAVGPRLGMAYQINSKTVLRAGWGIVYSGTGIVGAANATSATPFAASSPFGSAMTLRDGIPLTPAQYAWPDFSPGRYPTTPTNIGASFMSLVDPNAGRPARQIQWSIGLQRELTKNLVIDASYVANRGTWWSGNSLLEYNAISPAILAANGLDITSAADRTILAAPLSSVNAGRFQNRVPFAGFPTSQTVAQSLRPFPQFTTLTATGAPLGSTWYDSLQMKLTKRFSHGLDFTSTFSYQKELQLGAETDSGGPGSVGSVVNDVFNRKINKYLSGQSVPFSSVMAVNYRTPRWGGKLISNIAGDWTLGAVLTYASGFPILVPRSTNSLNTILGRATNTFVNRVPGVNPFTVDLNCHCFDPSRTFVLNPAAWQDPGVGNWGTAAAYYNDYRNPRRPQEAFNFGRVFRIHERVQFQIRAEFQNILNRAYFANPTFATATATPQTNQATGITTAGFGFINTTVPLAATFAAPGPRSGNLVARFTF
jgi:Carboxypeptidase regulatory-like domain/TonB dependent receptor